MKGELGRFSTQQIAAQIIKWGTQILFVGAVAILAYMSFVDNFNINPSLRNITTLGLIALVLNWLVWDSNYKNSYERILTQDLLNKEYCIHKRYYFARTGWKYSELQARIREYNKDFVKSWIADIEDITGRTEQEIVEGKYKGNPHKMLIYKLKHRKYPKTGLRTPKDMLFVLSVGRSNNMKVNVRQAERHRTKGRMKKAITSLLSCGLGASLVFEFIHSGWEGALLKLFINILLLGMSLFFGTLAGLQGGKLKLATAEEISEKLEEWRNMPPVEVPFKAEIADDKQAEDSKNKEIVNKQTIELM